MTDSCLRFFGGLRPEPRIIYGEEIWVLREKVSFLEDKLNEMSEKVDKLQKLLEVNNA